ncbi:uncharacterized protein [Primulina huaijiensis]|uniref:uncharacterized protein n=1 Tax=Primulina huaijiensis TaxID=1492673 RepID=UPI003CC72021
MNLKSTQMGNPNFQQSNQTAPVLTHFSHPHALKISNTSVSQCSACKLEASGAAYSCTVCSFTLHKKCYDLPQKIKHGFDQAHVLSLQPTPVYPEGVFKCDACGIQGDGFSYHCSPCGTDLHSICASLPMILTHNCHQHQLSMTFSAPYAGNAFSCDICKRVGSKTWLYRCNSCEFDVHLTCVAKIPSSTPHKHQMIPQSPQHNLPRSISDRPNMYTHNTGVHGVARPPHHSASMGNPQNQFVTTPYSAAAMGQPYPAAVTPMSSVPYNNFGQPATYGPATPPNGSGNQILGNVANGIASGISQATAQAMIQGFMGGDGTAGGGSVGAGGGVVDATGGGAGTPDGSFYVDGDYGGTDLGHDAGSGDVSYY